MRTKSSFIQLPEGLPSVLLLVFVLGTRAVSAENDLQGGIDETLKSVVTGTPNNSVFSILPMSDESVIVSGDFVTVDDVTQPFLAKLGPSGAIGTGFPNGTVIDGPIYSYQYQSDGKLVVAGPFSHVNAMKVNSIARFNVDGSLDLTFIAEHGLGEQVFILLQHDGKILVGGHIQSMDRPTLVRLMANGKRDANFSAPTAPAIGATTEEKRHLFSDVLAIAEQENGKILIAGNALCPCEPGNKQLLALRRLNENGSIDSSFTPPLDFGTVYSLLVQLDGKIVSAGLSRLMRLNPDGSIDSTFHSGAGIGDRQRFATVKGLALQPDGKILVAGEFISFDEISITNLIRLNADGTLDRSFSPDPALSFPLSLVTIGPNSKIFVGEEWLTRPGLFRRGIRRLNGNGSLDAGFQTDLKPGGRVTDLHIDRNGILIAGDFQKVNRTTRPNIARLTTTGEIDPTFKSEGGANQRVLEVTNQRDGKYIIGGEFTTYNGIYRPGLARLLMDGTLDPSFFTPVSVPYSIRAVAVAPDHRIVIGGYFQSIGGTARQMVARLQENGSVDTSFNPQFGADQYVFALALQRDGRVLVGGAFTTLNQVPRPAIGRLLDDGSLDNSFHPAEGADGNVFALAVDFEDRILVAGVFDHLAGRLTPRIGRLLQDGTSDTLFNSPFEEGNLGSVSGVIPLSDGSVIISGSFPNIGTHRQSKIARLLPNGDVDATFASEDHPNQTVAAVGLQRNGDLVIGGGFTHVGGVSSIGLARLTHATDDRFSLIPWRTARADGFKMTAPPPILQDVEVFMSSNLTTWVSLGSVSNTTKFLDFRARSHESIFYRAVGRE